MENVVETTRAHYFPSKAVIDALREEAKFNGDFAAVAKVFSNRERSRAQVTVNTLKAAMAAEQWNLTTEAAQHIIKFLADLKLGTLHKDTKGRIRGLINIKYTLQSIGKAAIVPMENALSTFKHRTKQASLPTAPMKTPPPVQRPAPKLIKTRSQLTNTFGVKLNFQGEEVDINLTPGEFKSFLQRILTKGVK